MNDRSRPKAASVVTPDKVYVNQKGTSRPTTDRRYLLPASDLLVAVTETAVRASAVAKLVPLASDPLLRVQVERLALAGALWGARALEWLELAEEAA